MGAREIKGRLFKVRGLYNSWFVETTAYGDWLRELCVFVAQKVIGGHHITSVTELSAHDTSTPRVPVLNTKEYKAVLKDILADAEAFYAAEAAKRGETGE